jgi:endonuclease-8
MPEGHTIHGCARDHTRFFGGQIVRVSSPQGRFAEGAAAVDGTRFLRASAHGKHLFHEYEGGRFVHVHLGLYGEFYRHDVPPPEPRPTVRMRIEAPEVVVDLIGATACELLDRGGVQAILDRLGPDPIKPRQDPSKAYERMRRSRTTIGQALMDQSVLAGIGNVYRAEVLHTHRIHPERPANTITVEEWQSMWQTLVRWLRQAVKDQVIITIDPRDFGKRRSNITRGEALYVYKRDACWTCAGPIRRWDLGGRWAYACEECQAR